MSPFRRALAPVFFITVFCAAAWSQMSFTSLRGTVTDSSGAVIPGATVSIVNKSTSLTSNQAANGSGESTCREER